MKVQPGAPAAPNASQPKAQPKSGAESKFGKALEEKRKTPRPVKEESAPANAVPLQPQPMVAGVPLNSGEVSAPARTRTINAVAAEIQVHLSPGVKEVSIQFGSKVLDGLEVRIRSEGGAIAVELIPHTARAHDTVTGGVDQLTASLQAKGIPVASVRVASPDNQREPRERGGQGGGQGGGQNSGQQGGRGRGGRQ